ncbi:MAG: aminotransferase class I/II-fold pyridoxal phosphate-dependent enzyme [candidate division NC10 bacterium]|nr:aminotransferase class I/II-fold pyridoxal phosphate-dependent enzyme [candidate division NC10 bacterium]
MDIFDKCYRYTDAKKVMAAGIYPYFKVIQSAQDPEVIVDGRRMIMVGSNSYLGLTSHPRIREAAIRAVEQYGTGCAGSRFLNGTIDLHHEVEARLAKFKKKEAALLFAAGYQTNLGVISALVAKDDVVIIDRWNHASIIDGCRLAFGQTLKYRHNDMEALERILTSHPGKGKLIVVDGVFSMEGDIVNLPEIVQLARKYGARIMVDDAHATGVLGKEGRGTAQHFGLEEEVDIIMGTCSKALAAVGGFIASTHEVIHYLQHIARSMMFSASLPPSCVATIGAAVEVIEQEPERRAQLWKNAQRVREGFKEMGFDTGLSETPIIPVIIGDEQQAFLMGRALYEHGIFTNVSVRSAVPEGRALIRTSYMATHTDAHIDQVLQAFRIVGRELGVI